MSRTLGRKMKVTKDTRCAITQAIVRANTVGVLIDYNCGTFDDLYRLDVDGVHVGIVDLGDNIIFLEDEEKVVKKEAVENPKYVPTLQSQEEWIAQRVAAVSLHISMLSNNFSDHADEINKCIGELNILMVGSAL